VLEAWSGRTGLTQTKLVENALKEYFATANRSFFCPDGSGKTQSPLRGKQ
jgi:hypothetical protein